MSYVETLTQHNQNMQMAYVAMGALRQKLQNNPRPWKPAELVAAVAEDLPLSQRSLRCGLLFLEASEDIIDVPGFQIQLVSTEQE